MNIYDEFSIAAPSDCTSKELIPCDQLNKKFNKYNEAIDQFTNISTPGEHSTVLSEKDKDANFDVIWNSVGAYEGGENSDDKENGNILIGPTDNTHGSIFLERTGNSILTTDKGNLIDDSISNSYKSEKFNQVFKELDSNEAITDLFQNITGKTDSVENQLYQLSLCAENHDNNKSLRVYKKFIKSVSVRSPKTLPVLYYNLGIIYLRSNNSKKALRSFHLSVQKNLPFPENYLVQSMAFFQIGLLQLDLKEYRKSSQAFHEALAIYEDSSTKDDRIDFVAKINNNLGVSYVHRKKYTTAYHFFNSALSINRIKAQKIKFSSNEIEALALVELDIADILCNIISVVCEMHKEGCEDDINDQLKIIHCLKEIKSIRMKYFGKYFGRYEKLIQMRKLEHMAHRLLLEKYIPLSTIENASEFDLYLHSLVQERLPELDADVSGVGTMYEFYTISRESLTLISVSANQISNVETSEDIINSKSQTSESINLSHSTSHNDEFGESTTQKLRLASLLFQNGKYNESLKAYNEILPEVKKIFGIYHPLLAIIWQGIGNIKIRLEKYQDALCAFQNAINVQYHNSNKDNIDTAESYAKIGIVYLLQQKYDMALDIFQQVLTIRVALLGKSHPQVARIYNNMGSVFVQTDSIRKARRFFQLALDIQRNAATTTTISANESNDAKNLKLETAMTLLNLGTLNRRMGEWENAEKMFRDAYNLQRDVLGSQNPIALTTLKMISVTKRKCIE